MADHNESECSNLRVEDIVRQKSVIHPALDWVDGQLVVGVVFEKGHRAVLTSRDGLVEIEKIGPVCERDGKFDSPVTREIAREFMTYLETKPTSCSKEDANGLLRELAEYFSRFVVFPEKYWSTVMAAWTLGTYLFPVFQAYPYLWLTSSEPGCGKSLLGQMIANLSFNGEFMSSPTEANMFHLPEQNRGVQVWDEVELANQVEKGRFQSVKAILLNGYRNGGMVPRQVGKNWDQQVRYHVYCPRVLIGLSQLPETARQRSIMLRLRKRNGGQEVPIYRVHDQSKKETELKTKCVLMALKCAEDVNRLYLNNSIRRGLETLLKKAGREVDDIWLPLFSVVAAGSSDAKIDPEEDSFLGDLARAAKQLAIPQEDSTQVDRTNLRPAHRTESAKTIEREEPNKALVVALGMLEWEHPFEPTDLAERVSEHLNREVTVQWLSKNLGKIGIKAKKRQGRRVFYVTPSELERTKAKLGICDLQVNLGQHGQEGRQPFENEVEAISRDA